MSALESAATLILKNEAYKVAGKKGTSGAGVGRRGGGAVAIACAAEVAHVGVTGAAVWRAQPLNHCACLDRGQQEGIGHDAILSGGWKWRWDQERVTGWGAPH